MNISESIKQRWRRWQIEHFAITRYGRELAKLKNINAGRRCFIIGNGPSLRADDLDVLAKHDEITFAFNRIYNIFDQTIWRPTYYMSQDVKMLTNTYREMSAVPAERRFFPIEVKWYAGIPLNKETFYHLRNSKDEIHPDFSENVADCIYTSRTVVYSAIQLAVYMGFHDIYILGVDHHFHISMNAKGELVVDPTAKDYFSDNYNIDKNELYIPNTDESTYTYIAAKKYADANGINIYNATRGGKLEVYPRVDFDNLF